MPYLSFNERIPPSKDLQTLLEGGKNKTKIPKEKNLYFDHLVSIN